MFRGFKRKKTEEAGVNKYHNKEVIIDGIKFKSTKEGRFYLLYKQMEKNGEISNLRMQVPYELIPAIWRDVVKHLKTKDKIVKKCVQRAVHYVADFVFIDNLTGKEEVIDAKGFRTKEYKLKKKMMLAFKNIEIKEV